MFTAQNVRLKHNYVLPSQDDDNSSKSDSSSSEGGPPSTPARRQSTENSATPKTSPRKLASNWKMPREPQGVSCDWKNHGEVTAYPPYASNYFTKSELKKKDWLRGLSCLMCSKEFVNKPKNEIDPKKEIKVGGSGICAEVRGCEGCVAHGTGCDRAFCSPCWTVACNATQVAQV